jgi:predicted transcriptional regulator
LSREDGNIQRQLRRGGFTEILILRDIVRNPGIRITSVARNVGTTKQHVYALLARMQKKGLITQREGTSSSYSPTLEGIQYLHERLAELKNFVEEFVEDLSIVESCVAVARTDIGKGKTVGLFMERGILVAYEERESPSEGTAAHQTACGDPVLVRDLRGIVDLRPGVLTTIEIPDLPEDAESHEIIRRITEEITIQKPDRVAVLDTSAHAYMGRVAHRVPLVEFIPVEATLAAIQLGLDVLAVGCEATLLQALPKWQEHSIRPTLNIVLGQVGSKSQRF